MCRAKLAEVDAELVEGVAELVERVAELVEGVAELAEAQSRGHGNSSLGAAHRYESYL